MKGFIAGLVVMAWANGAMAVDWVRLISNGKGDSYSVDLDSDKRLGDKITIWVKENYADTPEHASYGFLSSAALKIYNCSDRTHATKQRVLYSKRDLEGVPVASENTKDYLLEYEHVVPGSVTEELLIVLCGSID